MRSSCSSLFVANSFYTLAAHSASYFAFVGMLAHSSSWLYSLRGSIHMLDSHSGRGDWWWQKWEFEPTQSVFMLLLRYPRAELYILLIYLKKPQNYCPKTSEALSGAPSLLQDILCPCLPACLFFVDHRYEQQCELHSFYWWCIR